MRNEKTLSGLWLLSLLAISVFAGTSWIDALLAPDAGGQQIQVNGFLVFPVAAALLLLQAAALLASYFAPNIIGRIVAGTLAVVMLFHLLSAGIGLNGATELALSGQIYQATGILGLAGQNQLLESRATSLMWVGYLLCIAINIVLLTARATLGQKRGVIPISAAQDETADLWESQN